MSHAPAATSPDTPAPRPQTLGGKIRELADELIFVFVLVMFIKMFVVELYKIPSGSMTPTLLGGTVAFANIDDDQVKDLAYWETPDEQPLIFLKQGDRYLLSSETQVDPEQIEQWFRAGLVHKEFDQILVNKLAYWFRWPRRGEIVIFKVPPVIYRPEAPIYVKRLVGEPGDELTFTKNGLLVANGKLVEQPDFFQTQHYLSTIDTFVPGFRTQPEVEYRYLSPRLRRLEQILVPPDEAYVLGDNTSGSLDSRYWGGVPLTHFKGRAFLRVFPLSQIKFLR